MGLKSLREEVSLSQVELAKKLGVQQGEISSYENRRRFPNPARKRKIAAILTRMLRRKITPADLDCDRGTP